MATGPGDTRAVCIVCYTFIGDTVCNRSVTVCIICYTFIGDTVCNRSVTVCIICYTSIGDTVCNRSVTRAVCIFCYTFIGDTVCNRSVTRAVCIVCYTFIEDTDSNGSVTGTRSCKLDSHGGFCQQEMLVFLKRQCQQIFTPYIFSSRETNLSGPLIDHCSCIILTPWQNLF